jgi:hypothetical protein
MGVWVTNFLIFLILILFFCFLQGATLIGPSHKNYGTLFDI